MDNATHAFAGLLLADATTGWIERRTGARIDPRLHRIVAGVGIVAAELPDADLAYSGPVVGMGKLGYLLHHRGHTHTVVFAIVAGFVIWWIARALRGNGERHTHAATSMPLLVLAIAGTLSHLLLDFSNSYGVHPFWPVDNRWFYGDAVFIVEPWLWVVAIPALLAGPRRTWSRVLLSALLALILVVPWTLGQLPTVLVLGLALTARVLFLWQRRILALRRAAITLGAWLVVEIVFGVSSARAHAFMQTPLVPDERVVDVVLTPAPANPFCFDALVVTLTSETYHVRSATVAPWASSGFTWRSAPRCRGRTPIGRLGATARDIVPTTLDSRVQWSTHWSAPRAELRALSESRCAVAAALRFMRVPMWTIDSTRTVDLFDARFGVGSAGFAGLRVKDGPCDLPARAWVPPWVPPRADALTR